MRKLLLATAALFAVATPALAGTVEEIVAHGATMDGSELTFSNDSFSIDGAAMGTYRIDGDKLCLKMGDAQENCIQLPADKKSGDAFEMDTPDGKKKIAIH